MSSNERLRYLVTGVQPRERPGGEPRIREGEADAARRAKYAVATKIEEREAALRELLAVLPEPADAVHQRGCTRTLLMDANALAGLRRSLAARLAAFRWACAQVTRAISEWRGAMRGISAYYNSLPDCELTFMHRGENYLLRMACDAKLLPAPVRADPLLLRWFDEELPWIVSTLAAGRRISGGPDLDVVAIFAVNATGRQRSMLEQSQRMVLDELTRMPPEAHLAIDAVGGGGGDGVGSGSAAWRWSAFQVILYGGEYLALLLTGLAPFARFKLTDSSSRLIQRAYRCRLTRRVRHVFQASIAAVEEAEAVAQTKLRNDAALTIQNQWKGFIVRRIIRDATESLGRLDRGHRKS